MDLVPASLVFGLWLILFGGFGLLDVMTTPDAKIRWFQNIIGALAGAFVAAGMLLLVKLLNGG